MSELEKLYHPVPERKILFYTEYQEIYGKCIQLGLLDYLHEGIPDTYNEIRDIIIQQRNETENGGHVLAVFDDAIGSLDRIQPLYTIGSHHLKCSVISEIG